MENGGKRPGSGRPAGSPNKRTIECKELAEKLGINPFEILLLMSGNKWKELGYKTPTKMIFTKGGEAVEVDRIEVSDRISAASSACKYLFPQRKAIDFGPDANAAVKTFAEMIKQIADGKE